MRRTMPVLAASALVGGLLIAAPTTASAAAFTMTVATDSVDDDPGDGICADALGECSLRAAIQEANASAGADVITLTASNIDLTLGGAGEDAAATGDLDITSDITLLGFDDTLIVGQADPGLGGDRIFDVLPTGTLTMTGGEFGFGGAQAGENGGGGVRNAGTTTLNGVTVTQNLATEDPTGSGGGILNSGVLTLTDTVVTSNSAKRAGGGIEATAGSTTTIVDGVLQVNDAGAAPGNGGALHVTGDGVVTITGTDVSNNTAVEGGGVWNSTAGTLDLVDAFVRSNTASGAAADQGGGGVYTDGGDVTIDGTAIFENDATGAAGSGGGLLNAGATVTISGDATVTDNTAAGEGGGLWNSATGVLQITDTSIRLNTASGAAPDQGGGGVFNDGGELTVDSSEIFLNTADGAAGSGGGILNDGGDLTVEASDLSANTAQRAGGGIESDGGITTVIGSVVQGNDAGATPGNGGGLHLTGAGDVTVGTSLFRDNLAVQGGGLWSSAVGTTLVDASTFDQNEASGEGGALYNDGGQLFAGNVTIDGNLAAAGGAFFSAGGTAGLLHATVSDNDSGLEGLIAVANSIVAGNGDDCTVDVESLGGNVLADTCEGTDDDVTGLDDPQLNALATNGSGQFTTRSPQTGSPAIDAGLTNQCLPVDQNGVVRPDGDATSGGLCDAGAVEVIGGAVPDPIDPDPTDPDPTDPTGPDPTDPDPTDPTGPAGPTGPQGPVGSAGTPAAAAAQPVRAQPNYTG